MNAQEFPLSGAEQTQLENVATSPDDPQQTFPKTRRHALGAGVAPSVPIRNAISRPPNDSDKGALVGLGLAVRRLGIDNPSQFAAQFGDVCRVGRIVRQIGCLVRVGVEIEELGLKADILVILPTSLPKHECTGRRSEGVILGEGRPLWVKRLARNVE